MSVRIYKNKSHKNRIISVFFTEIYLAAGITALTGYALFNLLPNFTIGELNPITTKVVLTLSTGIIYYFLLTQQFEGKTLTTWVPVRFLHYLRTKQVSQTELKSMSDYYYKIKEQFIHTKDKLLCTFILHPVDLAVMDDLKQKQFFFGMQKFLHGLNDDEIQISISNRRALVDDFEAHFKFMLEQAKKNRVGLTPSQHDRVLEQTTDYVSNLKEKIQQDYVPFKEFMLTIGVRLPRGSNSHSYEQARQSLVEKINTYIPRLEKIGIRCEILLKQNFNSKQKNNKVYEAIYKNIQQVD